VRRTAVLVLCASLFAPSLARAEEPAKTTAEGDIETAKDLFRKGVALFEAGDIERALDFFLRSRGAFASSKNTLNAAICLERLGRADEAIELYEEVLTKFSDGIDANARAGVISATAALRKKVGSIDVSANVDGMLVIDGRMRGKLPLVAAVRVLPGSHVVRVIKDGWDTFQQTVKVEVGQTVAVDAKLTPLTTSGKLRVEAPGLEGGSVFIDGAAVGEVPWEGNLAPGPHVCFVQKDDRGSDPRLINVIKSQSTSTSLEARPLGVSIRVVVEPATAQLTIDGVPVGSGRWQGRLTLGNHSLAAREVGYVSRTVNVDSSAKSAGEQVIKLDVDRSHPRWAVAAAAGSYWIDLTGGLALGGSLGSDAESSCTSCKGARGLVAAARFGYELPIKVSAFVGVGYLSLSRDVHREIQSSFPSATGSVPVTYALDDRLTVTGPMGIIGAGYRLPFGRFSVGARVSLGVAPVAARDAVTGNAFNSMSSAEVDVAGSGKSERGVLVLAIPEIHVGVRFGAVELRVGVGALASLANGPRLDTGEMTIATGTCRPGSVECAKGSTLVARERAFGRFLMWVPEVGVGVSF
jgi:hypothetical protein